VATTYDVSTDLGRVRLLLNDVAAPWVFQDAEVQAFLDLEGSNVKRAAAQAIDTNADNELLASKVITTQDVATDGSKLASVMHARAESLRKQADADLANSDDGSYFDVVDTIPTCGYPELSGW
jgi:hypothetical protein